MKHRNIYSIILFVLFLGISSPPPVWSASLQRYAVVTKDQNTGILDVSDKSFYPLGMPISDFVSKFGSPDNVRREPEYDSKGDDNPRANYSYYSYYAEGIEVIADPKNRLSSFYLYTQSYANSRGTEYRSTSAIAWNNGRELDLTLTTAVTPRQISRIYGPHSDHRSYHSDSLYFDSYIYDAGNSSITFNFNRIGLQYIFVAGKN